MPKPRRPQHRKDEPLHAYVDRVCDFIIATQPNREELKELLHGVSVESYIAGHHAAEEIFAKYATQPKREFFCKPPAG
jgi:hypothetical protein